VKTVAALSEKGGVGKTTVIVHVGVAAQFAGLDVAIIDLDPQTSAADWVDERGEDSKPEAVAIPPARLDKLLAALRTNGTDLVLIDTPREANNAGYIAAKAADLVLIPFRRGGFDFRALKRTLDLCRVAGKRPCILLNGLRIGASRVEADAREALVAKISQLEHECDIAPVVVHDRAAYVTASITAKTAQETDPTGAAAAETKALFLWIAAQLKLSTTRQREKKATA
jgi:chromosome partitioning protein